MGGAPNQHNEPSLRPVWPLWNVERRRGFSLTELLIATAVLALAAALLLPIFVTARERGRGATCLSNVGQLARAVDPILKRER